MAEKTLSEKQIAALHFIAEVQGKSGGFYADFGHRAVTLSSLHQRGLLRTGDAPIIGAAIYRAQWFITPAGRAALSRSAL